MDTPEFDERRKQSVWERLEEVGQEYRSGHKAHRTRIEQLEHHLDALDATVTALTDDVKALASAPVEATKLRFSAAVVVTIIVVTASVVGSAYGISTSIKGDVAALGATMRRQAEDDKKDRESLAKLYDERNLRTLGAIDTLTRQQKLLEYEMQRLREDVTKKNGSSR